jgi:dynamin family protein
MTTLDPESVMRQLQIFAERVPPILRKAPLTQRFALEVEQNTSSPESALLTLAIVGKMKIGKSTLINALIGQDLALLGVTETTATINRFSYGSSEQSQSFRVHWKDATGAIEDRDLSLLPQWSSNTELARRTQYLEFFSPSELLKTMEIFDTPGTGSTYREDEQTTREFMLGEGGCADCLVYMLLPVAHGPDTGFLDEFRDHTRLPHSYPYNSVAVIHKWESINHPAPWQYVQRTAGIMADRISRYVADVIPVSGPLIRALAKLSPEVWNRLAEFASETPAPTLQQILIGLPENFLQQSNCPFDAPFRDRLLRDLELPWPCFSLVLKVAISQNVRDGQTLREAVHQVSGASKLLDFIRTRFLERSRVIRSSTRLAKAFRPCELAIDCLRDEITHLSKLRTDARTALLEMQGLERRLPAAHSFLDRNLEDVERRTEVLDKVLRDLELEITDVRESFDQFHGDLKAVRTVEADPKCLNKDEVTEVLTILGIYGHSCRERLAATDISHGVMLGTEKRIAFWRARYESSAGNRAGVLLRVVVRLEQIAQVLSDEVHQQTSGAKDKQPVLSKKAEKV